MLLEEIAFVRICLLEQIEFSHLNCNVHISCDGFLIINDCANCMFYVHINVLQLLSSQRALWPLSQFYSCIPVSKNYFCNSKDLCTKAMKSFLEENRSHCPIIIKSEKLNLPMHMIMVEQEVQCIKFVLGGGGSAGPSAQLHPLHSETPQGIRLPV